ncbi:MAG: TlpA family protein disulfide reductase [Prevotella sp.]|nr:TlpA family protein disulfide reductase [Prevotella sp.]
MKKTIMTLALLASFGWTSAQSTVKLTVKGLADGTVIEAALGSTHQTENAIATATLAGGEASFNLPIEEPRMIDFRVKDVPGTLLHLMTTKGENVSATLTAQEENGREEKYYSSTDEKVYNSPLHAQYMMKIGAFKKFLGIYNDAYHDGYKDINDKVNAAYASKDSVRMAQLRGSQEWKDFLACDANFFKMLQDRYPKMFAENADSWWGPFMQLDTYSYFTPENKLDYDKLSDAAKNSYYGQILKEQIFPKGMTGMDYPKFDVLSADGKTTPSTKLTKGKKYLLIDFWASWCVPCRKEIPNLKNCYAQYKDKGLQIISISLDRNDAAWKKALKEEQLAWPNGVDKAKIADAYKVQAIPAMFLVDVKTGKIIGDGLRGEVLRNKLAELMP